MAEGQPVDERSLQAHYEIEDIPPGRIALVGLLLMVVLALSLGGVAWELGWFEADHRSRPSTLREDVAREPPLAVPRLQADPAKEGHAIDADASKRLHGLGWEDRERGIVHVPIERAIDRLAASGWPFKDADTTGPRAGER